MQRSVALSLLFGLGLSLAQNEQIAYIYDLPNYDESGAFNWMDSYCADFRDCDHIIGDDMISSTCVFGVWLFYSEYYYNYQNFGAVEWGYGDDFCWNLNNLLNNEVSSLRYAGDTYNWRYDTITLYEFDLFFGFEVYEWADMPEVPGTIATVGSLIVTGQNYWTVYTEPFFNGNHACISVQTGQYVGFAPDLSGVFGISTVRSFRRGCFSDNKIHLNSDRHGFVVKARE
ncbi:unnamed protein product [Darwinula stevensoni]|uniref:Uncharacterized protein n=1 Tax=Darwinula stevensoni TaxID=69355 RepID=A0A7R9FS25_9CRUS|nr:unnamed protein product [Darwinula stevensoni]CAG0902637.1 unnamed protein product [Darwinula stevensoni]